MVDVNEYFKNASRLKYRYETVKGDISTEDLWQLPVPLTDNCKSEITLDIIAKTINKQIKAETEESFVSTKNKNVQLLETKLEIVKEVIRYKIAEANKKREEESQENLKSRVRAAMFNKQNQELESMSIEELTKLLN